MVSAYLIERTTSSKVWMLRELQRLNTIREMEMAPFCVGMLYSCRPHAYTKQESPDLPFWVNLVRTIMSPSQRVMAQK